MGFGTDQVVVSKPEAPVDTPPVSEERPPVSKYIKPAIMPTVGAVGGTVLGSMLTPVLGPAGPVLGEMGGSILGEGANQVFGVTEPDLNQLLLAGALPPAFRQGVNAIKAGARFFPPSAGARTLNEIAPLEAARKVESYRPSVPASQLYKESEQLGEAVPMQATLQRLDQLSGELNQLSSGARAQKRDVQNYITGLYNKIADNNGKLTATEWERERQALGEIVGNLQGPVGGKGALGLRESKQLYESLWDDLEKAGTQTGTKLSSAVVASRREQGIRDLERTFTRATKSMRGQGDEIQFNANQVINEMKKDRFFTKSFSPEEQKDIYKTLTLLNKIPPLPLPRGVQFGSGRLMQTGIRTGAGAGLGAATGHELGPVIGGAAAFAIPPAAESIRNFAIAMQTGIGRGLLKDLLVDTKGTLTPRVAAVLGAFVASTQAQPELVNQ